MPTLGEQFPNFKAKSTHGDISFHEWLGKSWGILFSHPADFTPVCTTELARLVRLMPEFEKRDVRVVALSCDEVESHKMWTADIKAHAKDDSEGFPYPIVDDSERRLAVLLGMLDADELDAHGVPLTARSVFVVDPAKKFRLSLLYPATVGRNFDEILRAVDALQLTDRHRVATPADWRPGDDCMVQPTVPAADVRDMFPRGVSSEILPSGRDYMRSTPHP